MWFVVPPQIPISFPNSQTYCWTMGWLETRANYFEWPRNMSALP